MATTPTQTIAQIEAVLAAIARFYTGPAVLGGIIADYATDRLLLDRFRAALDSPPSAWTAPGVVAAKWHTWPRPNMGLTILYHADIGHDRIYMSATIEKVGPMTHNLILRNCNPILSTKRQAVILRASLWNAMIGDYSAGIASVCRSIEQMHSFAVCEGLTTALQAWFATKLELRGP